MLSFIVPAYNEEFELPRTLAALRKAAVSVGRPYEIIVVDDGSTDATPRISTAEGAVLVQIQRRQIAAARNAGAAAARGGILFFVDADTQIQPEHITSAVSALTSGCSGGSALVAVDGAIPPWARIFLRVFSFFYFGNNLGAGAFLFTTRENFQRVGGFDEQLFIGEEVYLSIALKKIGRFKILSLPVLTSGRKLRMHSGARILSGSVAIMLRGKRGCRKRENCEFWYDGRREDGAVR